MPGPPESSQTSAPSHDDGDNIIPWLKLCRFFQTVEHGLKVVGSNKFKAIPRKDKNAFLAGNERTKGIFQMQRERWTAAEARKAADETAASAQKAADETAASSPKLPAYEEPWMLMRLLLPQFTRSDLTAAKMTFGLKEAGLAKIIINALCLPPKGKHAERLKLWNRGVAGLGHGVFFRVLYHVLLEREHNTTKAPTWTIDHVNRFLGNLHAEENEKDKQTQMFRDMLDECTPLEIKWIVAEVLQHLHISLSEKDVLTAYHEDALDYFKVNCNLSTVTRDLEDPQKRMNKQGVQYFMPFRPMLSEKVDPYLHLAKFGKNDSKLFEPNSFGRSHSGGYAARPDHSRALDSHHCHVY